MSTNGKNGKHRSVVVIQLSGGDDALNTVVPYGNGLYYDFRPYVNIAEDDVLPLEGDLGLNPSMASMKRIWDKGNLAIINGVGYPNPNRSHFRSMDVWHTAESEKIGDEGWLGQTIRDLDPKGENVLTGVNFGRGLPRALHAKDVSVASVGNLETYGLFPDMEDEKLRAYALEALSQMYGADSKDNVSEFIKQTGTDALKGADILRTAPQQYSSSIEYAENPIAENMKSIAQVMTADLGTRIYYTAHGSFDTHAGELQSHSRLWTEVSDAVGDFMEDLEAHNLADDTVVLMFSEFGRRIRDNGAGTDHGSGGVAFVIGGSVNGGLYGEYPSLDEDEQLEGDLHFNNDFRSTYSTILDRWLGLDPAPITNGDHEQFNFISK
tara:strand:+ start:558 stop:1697 length:1140 start_codon:yes stop_codon:yes gene_type:complete